MLICYGTSTVVAFKIFHWTFLQLPFTPSSAIGIAVVFYVGLKNSTAYERLWEARNIWGNIVNYSRQWGVNILNLVGPYTRAVQDGIEKPEHQPNEEEKNSLKNTQKELIMRHLAFINALRYQLRQKLWWEQEHKEGRKIAADQGNADSHETLMGAISPYLSIKEAQSYEHSPNAAVEILHRQSKEIRDLWADRWIDSFHHTELMQLVGQFFSGMGASERIKTFPFPRQYATFSRLFIYLFCIVLPFSLIGEIHKELPEAIWLVIPLYVTIGWIFIMMEVIGGSSENPFENAVNDVPISSLCTIVEIDLRRMMGETDLPEKPQPHNDILM